MGALPAADRARTPGPTRQREEDLSDLRALALCPGGSQRRAPRPFREGEYRLPDRFGEVEADGEPAPHLAHRVQEPVGRPRRVGAHQHPPRRVLTHGLGDLAEGLGEYPYVVGRGVRTSVSGAQHPGEGFGRLIEVTHDRVETEAAFVGRGGVLLIGMACHKRRVDVEDDLVGPHTQIPRP